MRGRSSARADNSRPWAVPLWRLYQGGAQRTGPDYSTAPDDSNNIRFSGYLATLDRIAKPANHLPPELRIVFFPGMATKGKSLSITEITLFRMKFNGKTPGQR